MRIKFPLTITILFLLIVLENLCLYYFFRQGVWTTGKNALCLFFASLSFGLVFIYRFYNETIDPAPLGKKRNWLNYTNILLLLGGLYLIGIPYNEFFLERDIYPGNSDIIPIIQVACKRFVAGNYPYGAVTTFGWASEVLYLPMHWMPFSIAELFEIDYRWIPYGVWGIAGLILCVRAAKIANPVIRALVPLILLASNYVMFYSNNAIVEATVELMVAGYYMMLISGMNTGNGVLQGLIIGTCMLSRYSLVLWLPLYAFVLFVTGSRRQLYIATGTAVAMVMGLYVLPFLTRDPKLFSKLFGGYEGAAVYEWTHLNKAEQPIHLFSGTGFAYYFYTRFTGHSIPERIKLLQRTHLFVCLGVTALMCVWFWYKQNRIDKRIFLMGSFKIYLTFFLFLIQVPYEYLMCVGNFVSIALFCEQARYRFAKGTATV
jgi:hypothetical protein